MALLCNSPSSRQVAYAQLILHILLAAAVNLTRLILPYTKSSVPDMPISVTVVESFIWLGGSAALIRLFMVQSRLAWEVSLYWVVATAFYMAIFVWVLPQAYLVFKVLGAIMLVESLIGLIVYVFLVLCNRKEGAALRTSNDGPPARRVADLEGAASVVSPMDDEYSAKTEYVPYSKVRLSTGEESHYSERDPSPVQSGWERTPKQ